MIPKDGTLMRIFIGESDRYEGTALYEWIVNKAYETGMAGATVLRGMLGYGVEGRVHTTKILRLSQNLPIIIELVDEPDKIEEFIPIIDPAIGEGLITTERVNVRLYRISKEEE